jgi:K+-transporting ATPase KdpF subunit
MFMVAIASEPPTWKLETMFDNIIAGVASLGLFIYLLYALLFPERV